MTWNLQTVFKDQTFTKRVVFTALGLSAVYNAVVIPPSFSNETKLSTSQETSSPVIPKPKWVVERVGGAESKKFIRISDTRGMGPEVPALLALGVSEKGNVVFVVQGKDPEIIHDAKHALGYLILDGHDRIGLVISDGEKEDVPPENTAYIYSKGHMVTTLTNIQKTKTEDRWWEFKKVVEEIYKRDVLGEKPEPIVTAYTPEK